MDKRLLHRRWHQFHAGGPVSSSIARPLIAKRQIRKSIHALYEKVWSAEHQRFFYYNVKNYKSQWSKPALLGPDDLTPRFYD